MIFHQHIETRQGTIWILDSSQNGYNQSENESRQQFERRVVNEIVSDIIGERSVHHHSNGAPYFKTRPELNISISHSRNWFALYISSRSPVGIDIEVQTPNMAKTQSYFLGQTELDCLKPNEQELQICWGIKEAIYKMYQGNIQSIKEDIEILKILDKQAFARVKDQEVALISEQHANFTMVYTN